MEFLLDINLWSAFLTLTILEVVLGIDNIIFITLMVNRLPEKQRPAARQFGLLAAMGTRILLLFSIAWVAKLTTPWFSIMEHDVSGRDLVLLFGGLFLIYKAVVEIHASLEGAEDENLPSSKAASFAMVIAQIAVIDIIFSLDSVITAIGLADDVSVMVAAVMVAIGVMMFAAKSIGEFVEEHPTVKMLALAFLVMVGAVLVAEGFGHHMPKGYLYFAIAFSLGVEFLNLRMKKKQKLAVEPVHLHKHYEGSIEAAASEDKR
uniref:Integral membrane protein TerC n=1 Tax=uncultured Thiotrichaceae bacterium TaxID=298394 RepID=A0A6S6U982_9GAMM|nr:MAG: Integral membrane protein TerC [uncultured Thiotrichaceae bacterium]